MTIRTKLLLGVLPGLLLILIIGLLAHLVLQLEARYDEAAERVLYSHQAIVELQVAVQNANMAVHDYLITGDLAYRNRFAELVEDVDDHMASLEVSLQDLAEGEALLRDIRAEWLEAKAVAEAILAMPDPVQDDAQRARLVMRMDAMVQELIDDLTEVERQHQNLARTLEASASTVRAWAGPAILVGTLIALIGGLCFAWYFSSRLSRPLVALTRVAEALGHGDLEARAKVEGDDEVARLGRVFNIMADRLQHRLFDSVPIGLYRLSPTGRILDANSALVQMLGFPDREALLAVNLVDLYVDARARTHWQEQLAREEMVRNFEVQVRRRDSTVIWVRNNARAVRDQDGRVMHYEGSLEDITERKRTEATWRALNAAATALQRADLSEEDIYQAATRQLATLGLRGVISLLDDDADMFIVECVFVPGDSCAAWEQWTGGTGNHRLRFPRTCVPAYAQVVETNQATLIADNPLRVVLQSAYGANGGTRERALQMPDPMHSIVVPLRVQGRVTGVLHVAADWLTEADVPAIMAFADQLAIALENARLYQAERERAERLSLLNHIARALSTTLDMDQLLETVYQEVSTVMPVDAFFIALYDSETAELDYRVRVDRGIREPPERRPLTTGLTGLVVMEKRPLLIRDLERERDRLPPIKLWGTMEAPRSWLGVPMLRGDEVVGVISVQSYRPNAYGEAEQELLLTIAEGVAVALENARLYASLQETNRQLQEALQAREEMIQNVSHELRTPLTLILGYIELLQEGAFGPLTGEQKHVMAVLQSQGERLYYMVYRLLTLQTLNQQALQKIRLDVRSLLKEAVQIWQARAAEAGVDLQLEIEEGLPEPMADPDLLSQVIGNLLDNAIKFSPNGGVVGIRAWREGNDLWIAVSDQGIGIPKDKLEQIFERFYQVDGGTTRHFGGMGIGLTLCRAIIEAHGGRIWAESEGPGHGSTFYIVLPLETGDGAEQAA